MSLHNKAKTSSATKQSKNTSRKANFENIKSFLIQVNNFTNFFNFKFSKITIVMLTICSNKTNSNINNKHISLKQGKNHLEIKHLRVLEIASIRIEFNSSTTKE